MIGKLYKRPLCIASGFAVPWITLISPNWLSLSGIAPSWAVLWLLPWAIEEGSFSASMAGLCLGLGLDSMTLGGPSQAPALILLGYWWGFLAQRGPKIEGSLKLGLLAWIGSVFLGFTLWIQILFINKGIPFEGFPSWGLNILLLNAMVTGLIAPIISSWLLLSWRRR